MEEAAADLKEKKTDPPPEATLPTDMREIFSIIGEGWDQEATCQRMSGRQWDAATTSKQGRKEIVEKEPLWEADDDDEDMVHGNMKTFPPLWERIPLGLLRIKYRVVDRRRNDPAMRFTYEPPRTGRIIGPRQTLQIVEIRGGLQWPLDVFGFIAIRDCIDRNRNVIFNRARDNCQALVQEDHNLVLAGPTRAVVCGNMGLVTLEVDLKAKGTTESKDKGLSFLAGQFLFDDSYTSHRINCAYTSKLSLSILEFKLCCIVRSVEATIFMRVTRGSWPDDFCCEFSALTSDDFSENAACPNNAACIDHEKIILLDYICEKLFAACDGKINLSRCVVSVGIKGELKISIKAWNDYNIVVVKEEVFTLLEAGLSYGDLEIGFCAVEVSVAWSNCCLLEDGLDLLTIAQLAQVFILKLINESFPLS
ncbi:hypothetical protein U9M48_016050 [Paspalum notatum var. saurae]|uniref:DUF6598 domain-containing protein n=1 Tax=Paspalum notatum var. saurae TaxID=547442 RepID=A0AAQ3T691_PASNO